MDETTRHVKPEEPLPDYHRRWYDHNQDVLMFVTMLEAIPTKVQDLFCEAAIEIADRYEEAVEMTFHERLRQAREGEDKELIRKLKLSQYKRRLYDRHPELTQIMNYLMLLGETEQKRILANVQELIQYSVDYIALCKRYEKDAEVRTMRQIADHYLDCNPDQILALLHNQEHFFRRQTISHEDTGSKVIKSLPNEMKIEEE